MKSFKYLYLSTNLILHSCYTKRIQTIFYDNEIQNTCKYKSKIYFMNRIVVVFSFSLNRRMSLSFRWTDNILNTK